MNRNKKLISAGIVTTLLLLLTTLTIPLNVEGTEDDPYQQLMVNWGDTLCYLVYLPEYGHATRITALVGPNEMPAVNHTIKAALIRPDDVPEEAPYWTYNSEEPIIIWSDDIIATTEPINITEKATVNLTIDADITPGYHLLAVTGENTYLYGYITTDENGDPDPALNKAGCCYDPGSYQPKYHWPMNEAYGLQYTPTILNFPMEFHLTVEINEYESITDLKEGWNLISTPENIEKQQLFILSEDTIYPFNQAVSEQIILPFIFGWDRTQQLYELVDIMETGEGYWFYTYEDCQLLY